MEWPTPSSRQLQFLVLVSGIVQYMMFIAVHQHPFAEELQLGVTSPKEHSDRAVFYNVFIPHEGKHRKSALKIVREQLQQLNQSRYMTSHVKLNYNLIGPKNSTKVIQKFCKKYTKVHCNLLQHYDEGDEGLTLDNLFNYCADNPTSIVTYMHDKGSFHPSDSNDRMRFMLTRAVFTEECQTLNPNVCNICSARFSFLPHMHFPGNIWTAHCSYIKKLIPPTKFPQAMQNMVNSVQKNYPEFNLDALELDTCPYRVGMGRFAYEHWATSHPDVYPCDVYDGPYRRSYRNLPEKKMLWKANLQYAGWMPQSKFVLSQQDKSTWFCGGGRLHEFMYLYGKLPPSESFVWDQYSKPFKECPHPIQRPTVNSSSFTSEELINWLKQAADDSDESSSSSD